MKPCARCDCAVIERLEIAGFNYSGVACKACGARNIITNAPPKQAHPGALDALSMWLRGEVHMLSYDAAARQVICWTACSKPSAPRPHLSLATHKKERP